MDRDAATVLLVAGLGPFLLRDLARGVQIPPHGVDASLWLIWEIPLFLAAVSVLLTGAAGRRGDPWTAARALAVGRSACRDDRRDAGTGRLGSAGPLAVVVHVPVDRRDRHARAQPAYVDRSSSSASTVAALGATTLVWGRTARGRVEAAVRDLAGLSQTDSVAVALLRRFGQNLARRLRAGVTQALLQNFVASDIASAGNPVALIGVADRYRTGRAVRDGGDSNPARRESRDIVRTRARDAECRSSEPVPSTVRIELVMAAPAATVA